MAGDRLESGVFRHTYVVGGVPFVAFNNTAGNPSAVEGYRIERAG